MPVQQYFCYYLADANKIAFVFIYLRLPDKAPAAINEPQNGVL